MGYLMNKQSSMGWQSIWKVALTLFALLSLTSCISRLQGGTEAVVGLPTAVELQCTSACAERGQCGVGLNQSDNVLLSSQNPAVAGHDVAIVSGARANVRQTVTQTLRTISTQEQFQHRFYQVQIEGQETVGWVAEWCAVPAN
jgi:hypothetical protein